MNLQKNKLNIIKRYVICDNEGDYIIATDNYDSVYVMSIIQKNLWFMIEKTMIIYKKGENMIYGLMYNGKIQFKSKNKKKIIDLYTKYRRIMSDIYIVEIDKNNKKC